jgi:hypothetical protein
MDNRKSFESKHPEVLGKKKCTLEQEMLKALEQKVARFSAPATCE